ncbi:MAG: hypothetical protein WBC06_14550 [Chitinophagaceae bacterium]
MENLDLIILTTIVVILFIVFILATFKEIMEDAKKPFEGGKERGPRADMMEFVGRIFSDESIKSQEKKELINIIKKKLDDIEYNENKTIIQ